MNTLKVPVIKKLKWRSTLNQFYMKESPINLQFFWNFTQNLSLIATLLDSIFSDNAGISAIEIEDGLSSAQLRIHIHTEQCSVNMGILLSCFYVYVFLNLCISVLWCPCMYIVQDSSARLRMYMGIQLIGFWCQIGTWGPEPTKHVAHSVGTHYTLNMNQRRLQKENTNTEEQANKN